MFGTSTSRLTSLILAAGFIGLAAPQMGAGPEVKRQAAGLSFHPPGFGKIQVRFGDRRRPEVVHVHNVAPCELDLSAFQSGSTVIVVANGANHESGYITRFEACDVNDRTPEITLMNTRGRDACAQVLTRFETTGSFNSRRQLSCIQVRVGDRVQEVRVVQAPRL